MGEAGDPSVRDVSVSASPMVVGVCPSSLTDFLSPSARAARAVFASIDGAGETSSLRPWFTLLLFGLVSRSSEGLLTSASSVQHSVPGELSASSESLARACIPARAAISGSLPSPMMPIKTASPWLGRTFGRLAFPLREVGGGLT